MQFYSIVRFSTIFIDITNPDQHGRESSPATPKITEHDALLKQKKPINEQIKNNKRQVNMVEDKCNTCQETFDRCKASILEKPSLALKDLSKLMRRPKHRHKQIEEASVVLIADFLAESKDIGK